MSIKQYFSHDVNALSDPKISIMIDDYGIVSYAYWWSIIERLASTESNSLELSKVNFRYFAKIWNQPVEFVSKFIQDLIKEYELLDTVDGIECWSNSLNRRIDMAEEKRLKKDKAGIKSGIARRKNKAMFKNVRTPLNNVRTFLKVLNKEILLACAYNATMKRTELTRKKLESTC